MTRDREDDLFRPHRALAGLDTHSLSVFDGHARYRALLDNVDAERASRPRIGPGHGVMAHRAAPALQEGAEHRIAAITEVDQRHEAFYLSPIEVLHRDAFEHHRVGASREKIALPVAMIEVHRATLAHHRVEVEVLLEPLPEFQRELIEADVLRLKIVGADDRGVAPDIAEPDRPLVDAPRHHGCRALSQDNRPLRVHGRRRRR